MYRNSVQARANCGQNHSHQTRHVEIQLVQDRHTSDMNYIYYKNKAVIEREADTISFILIRANWSLFRSERKIIDGFKLSNKLNVLLHGKANTTTPRECRARHETSSQMVEAA